MNHDSLRKFAVGQIAQIQENLEAAARYRIDNYHRQVARWRDAMPPDRWSQVRILIPGSPMARRQNLAVQYFAKLLGERGEGRRIVYAESLFAESQAMKLLGTHLFDTQIGRDFFDDPWRMHRDVLAAATSRYLETLSWTK